MRLRARARNAIRFGTDGNGRVDDFLPAKVFILVLQHRSAVTTSVSKRTISVVNAFAFAFHGMRKFSLFV